VAGDRSRSRELEAEAIDSGFGSHHWALSGPRLRLALTRGDLDEAAALVADKPVVLLVFGPSGIAARLDAIAALRDRALAEEEAAPLVRPGTYVEPFALRALGIVREDEALLVRADERFAALGLDWYREQTQALLSV
jgi:hypothetical protein